MPEIEELPDDFDVTDVPEKNVEETKPDVEETKPEEPIFEPQFSVGDWVKIGGLASEAGKKMNDAIGKVVKAADAATARYDVRLSRSDFGIPSKRGSCVKAIKEANLTKDTEPVDDAAAGEYDPSDDEGPAMYSGMPGGMGEDDGGYPGMGGMPGMGGGKGGMGGMDPEMMANLMGMMGKGGGKGGGGKSEFTDGDWNCPGCGDHQFGRNVKCRKCETPRPDGAGRGGKGGGKACKWCEKGECWDHGQIEKEGKGGKPY